LSSAKKYWSTFIRTSRVFKRLTEAGHTAGRLALFVCAAALLTLASSPQKDVRVSGHIGDDKCLECHQPQKSYIGTAHQLTSQLAKRESIAGDFGPGKNILRTSEPELHYRMEARKDGFYQTAVLGTPPDAALITERFDFVIGSGRKGQTYLFWGKDNQLFQLPVSYWTALGSWVHSPGYDDKVVNFSRAVLPRCLECHASFFQSLPDARLSNRYKKSDFVLGISCERCHGPGAEHAGLHSRKTGKQPDEAIVNPAKLSRVRQLEICSLCHGGLGTAKTPAFSYVAGKNLEDYLQLAVPKPDEAVDVHGNQVALLQRSRCFQSSSMTCSTCHDVHRRQHDPAEFSDRCLTCHKVQSCGLYPKEGPKLAGKCVACHLPNQSSNVIVSTHDGARLKPQVRNHWIKVYPDLNVLSP
jgi:hypothetical protein